LLNLTAADITVNGAALKGSATLTGSGTSRTLPIPASVTAIDRYAFAYWTSSQAINVQGKANQAAADTVWSSGSSYWRDGCDAVIKYWNGSSFQ